MDFSKIDGSATTLFVMVTPLALFALVLLNASLSVNFEGSKLWRLVRSVGLARVAAVAGIIAFFMIGTVAQHDSAGWFGQSTAAWGQALGSVAAIVAAIWIDQGAARRLRTDRAREREEAIVSRRGAMRHCSSTLADMADFLTAWDPAANTNWRPGSTRLRKLEGARYALNYYLRMATIEIDVRLVAALTTAEQLMGEAVTYFTSHLPVYAQQRDEMIGTLRGASTQIAEVDAALDE